MRSHRLPWLLLFLFLVFSTPLGAVKAQPAAAPRLDSPGDVIDAVNGLRVSHGLPPYTMSSILMGTAQGQADYMASIGSVTHTGPGGVSTTNRLLNAGYPLAGDLSLGGFRSENIVGSPGMTAQEAVNAWTGDDPHLHTMLSADLQEIGAGVAEADGVTYYVIDCARPTTSGLPQAYKPGVEAEFNSGDEIIVPVSIGTPDAQGNVYHEVQPGQSLWAIAIAYGVHIVDLQKQNGLGTSIVLQKGDKLLVKNVPTPTLAPPTLPATATAEEETPTSLPTLELSMATEPSTTTPTLTTFSSSIASGGAVAVIVLVALVAAGVVAWMGRARSI